MSRGDFVWYDYMAKDVAGAVAFYGETIGWKSKEMEGGPMPYTMLLAGEKVVGGAMPLPAQAAEMGAPPHWIAYIATEDVDATAGRTAELGGKVLQAPFDIPNVGRIAIMQDPQGAVFAGFTAVGEMPPGPDAAEAGAFSWTELMTSNWEEAFDFYGELFGWQKGDTMDMGDEGTYQLFSANGEEVGGMMNLTPEMPMPPMWLYYVTTDDIVASIARIEQNGGKKMIGPMEVPGGGQVAQFMDAQGGIFALYQHGAEA